MSVSQCPDLQRLEAFAKGMVAEDLLEGLAEHVENCPGCQRLLEAFDYRDDDLVDDLKGWSVSKNKKEETYSSRSAGVPDQLLEIAQSIHRDQRKISSESFDSGKRFARLIQEGTCQLGRFDLIQELGSGSFGYVFKAFDTHLQRFVAIKILRAGSLASQKEVERFFHEARSIAGLNHPGIVSVYDSVKSDDGDYYLVSEFIEGESLAERMKTQQDSLSFVAQKISEIADSLHYAHQHGIVHRDVKPSNIIVDPDEKCHLTDFGLAKLEIESSLTDDGQVLGTPAYMSPEQARGESHQVDPRSDIFSLGVVLYQMITGQRPFQGDGQMLLIQLSETHPPLVRKLNSSVPKDLETICHKAINKLPSDRYQTAGELSDDLQRFLSGRPIKARRLGWMESGWRWCRKFPLIASLIIAAPISLLAGLLYLMNLTSHLVRQTALESVQMEADMLETINNYYSEQVVGRLNWKETPVTHHYTTIDQSLPLPFTFMIDAADRITKKKGGMKVRIYSAYPWRNTGGPESEFQQNALEKLKQDLRDNPDDAVPPSYYRFQDSESGQVLLYGRAQIMKESCVKCHNDHKDSPKRDWKEGDLAGVLAITRPLENDTQNVSAGLKSAFYVVGLTTATLVGFSLLGIWGINRRKVRRISSH